MNNIFDDFNDVINNTEVERENKKFELTQLKLQHYHYNSGEIEIGSPIITSIELTPEYNFESQMVEWKKIITHTYVDLTNYHESNTITHTENINDINIIKEIEKNDLRTLKNNYFTEEEPERFSHWELTYNTYFKISGTYDQEIEEYKRISKLLEFDKIIENEINNIKEKLTQQD